METTTKYNDEFFCNPVNVNNLLTDANAMAELAGFRQADKGSKPPLSEHLRGLLTDVYATFRPVALNLINKRMNLFPLMNFDSIKDIRAEQNSRLWILIVEKFRWENYHEAGVATGAFVNYLDKSTGSFFARDLIRTQKKGLIKNRRKNNAIERPVEDQLMRKESPENFYRIWQDWREKTSEIYVDAVESRYLDDVSVEEQAQIQNLKPDTVKNRLIIGKKSLFSFLEKAGYMSTMDVISGKLIVDNKSRIHLLEKRTENLKKVLPNWLEILKNKPKLRDVLFAFYGLGDEAPLYDYKLAADKVGISISSARILAAEGVRLLMGQNQPSNAIREKMRNEDKFDYWQKHQNKIGLDQEASTILDLYFNQGLTHAQIAQKLKISEETVRRKKMHALELIDVVMAA